jgi:hypothetical protein
MSKQGPVTDEELAPLRDALEAAQATMRPEAPAPTIEKVRKWLHQDKPPPAKPLAVDMGMRTDTIYRSLYVCGEVPDVLFNAQGCMVEEPECLKCNDAGFVKEPVYGRGAWAYTLKGCPRCNPPTG